MDSDANHGRSKIKHVIEKKILIEGMDPDELISMEDLEDYAVADRPIVISIGAAEILVEFQIKDHVLFVQIAVVENGGEGVLPTLIKVIERAAVLRKYSAIEWTVLARNCSTPNPKLMRVLERLGFKICETASGSEYYWQRVSTNDTVLRRTRP